MTTADRLIRRVISDEGLLFIVGTHAWLTGFFLGWEVYITGEGRFLVPEVWPFVFLAGGLTALAYFYRRGSSVLWMWSGALILLAYLSRAAVIVIAIVEDPAWRRVGPTVGVMLWLLVAALVAALWHRALIPRRG